MPPSEEKNWALEGVIVTILALVLGIIGVEFLAKKEIETKKAILPVTAQMAVCGNVLHAAALWRDFVEKNKNDYIIDNVYRNQINDSNCVIAIEVIYQDKPKLQRPVNAPVSEKPMD